MALETFPPLVLVSVRYIISGSLVTGFALARGLTLPRGKELVATCFTGFVVLGIGNGALSFSELLIPSGIAGLILTMQPFWMVGAEALLPGGERLHAPTIGAMLLGLGGACLLAAPDAGTHAINRGMIQGLLVLQVGMATWCFGSIYQRRLSVRAHPIIAGGVQQLAAGLVTGVFALAVPHGPIHWSTRGVMALFYLVVFGSILGYSAYAYALDRLPVAIVSTYNYVNAVVAVTLGWLFYRERFGARELAAMVAIFLAVWAVKRFSRRVQSAAA